MFDILSKQEDDEDDLREEVMVYLSIMRRKSMDKEEEIKNPIEYYNRLWKCDDLRVDTNKIVKSQQQMKTPISSPGVSNSKRQSLSGLIKKKKESIFNNSPEPKDCFTNNDLDINVKNEETESIRRSKRKRKIKTNDFDFEFEYPNIFNNVGEDKKSDFDEDFKIQNFYNPKQSRKLKKKKPKVPDESEIYESYIQYQERFKISKIGPEIDTYEKYLKYRERNNESCRRNRLNQKLHQLELQQELISLESENIKLLSKVTFIESNIKKLGLVLMRLNKTDNLSSLRDSTANNDSISINFDKTSVVVENDKLSTNSDVSTIVTTIIKKELNDDSSVIEVNNDSSSNNDSLDKMIINDNDINNPVFVNKNKTKVCVPNKSNDDTEIDFNSCTKKSIMVDHNSCNNYVIDEESNYCKSEEIKVEIFDNISYDKDTIDKAKNYCKDEGIKIEIEDNESYYEDTIDKSKNYCKDEGIKVEIEDNESYYEDTIDKSKNYCKDKGIKVGIIGSKFFNIDKAKITVSKKAETDGKDKIVKSGWGTNFIEKYYEKNRDSIEDNYHSDSFDKVNDSLQDNSGDKVNNDNSERFYDKLNNVTTCDVNINNTNDINHFKSSDFEDKKKKEYLLIERSCSQSDNEGSTSDNEGSTNDDNVVKVLMSSDKKYQTVNLVVNTDNYNSSLSIPSSSETNESKSYFSSDDDLSLVIASDQDYDSEESDCSNSNNSVHEDTESIDNQNDFDKLDLKCYERSILDNLYLNAKEKVDAYKYIKNELRSKELSFGPNMFTSWKEYRRRNNIASKKSRLKKKLCIMVAQQQCMSLEQENIRLKSEVGKLEVDIKKLNTLLLRVFKKN